MFMSDIEYQVFVVLASSGCHGVHHLLFLVQGFV